jgi:L-2,4-diaminobutyrate decarboxylase
MNIEELLRTLEEDMHFEAGEAFLRVAARYLESSSGPRPVPESAGRLMELVGSPPRQGRAIAEVIAQLERDLVPNSNWLYHPRCLGHQVSPPLPAAVWAEPVIGALNQSMAVAEMSPLATAIETGLIRWMAALAGLSPDAGGVFTSGGTEATFTALLAARAAALPDAWENGVSAGIFVVTGEQSHYSVARAVAELGLGARQCLALPQTGFREDTDILARELDRLAAEGRTVMAVVTTAGSTATGRFDDLERVGHLCAERSLWMHVDACHGAAALFSENHRRRLDGLSRASSISWDPHKMMLLPLSTGVVLVRDERLLEAAFAQRAPYLFHGSAGERVWDQGTRSFQCSRRADAIKLWVALQRYGTSAFGTLYDHLCATTTAIHESISGRGDFEPGPAPECNIVCFRYIGRRDPADPALDAVNASLRRRFNNSGQGWITTSRLDGRQVLRMTVMNPRTRPADGDAILDALAELAATPEHELTRPSPA